MEGTHIQNNQPGTSYEDLCVDGTSRDAIIIERVRDENNGFLQKIV